MSTEVFVFADWEEFQEPVLVGTLQSSPARQKEHFSFNYDTDWLQSPYAQQIDPELGRLKTLNLSLFSFPRNGPHMP